MFEGQLKLLDYYFFGIGIASLIAAVFILTNISGVSYVTVFFYFFVFFVSFVLNSMFIKEIKKMYFWNQHGYILSHGLMTFIVSLITYVSLKYVSETLDFMLYFLIINFLMMFVMILMMIYQYRKAETSTVTHTLQ